MSAGRCITGWVLVRVTGAAPETLLRAMAERGMSFWDASPPEDFTLLLKTDGKTAKKLPALAASMGCEAEVVSRHGLPALGKKARRRRTLFAFLLGAALLLTASLSRIWSIEVSGCETIPEGEVLNALADCGIRVGASWLGMSQDQVRNSMILRLPEIRWMTVTMRGSHARVILREKRTYIEPVAEEEYAAVVSDKAGFVTEVQAKRGTAETQVNRAILPGETIIGGYATGRFGVQGPTRAIGYARVRTWHEITAALPVSVEEKTHTGAGRTVFSLVVGNFRLNFYKGSSICPPDCDKIIETYTLGRKGVLTLPISLEKITFRRFALREVRAEELPEELDALLMEELSARIGTEGEILSSAFTASERDGILYVTLRAECEETAGETVPLTPEDIAEIQMKIPKTEEPDT